VTGINIITLGKKVMKNMNAETLGIDRGYVIGQEE